MSDLRKTESLFMPFAYKEFTFQDANVTWVLLIVVDCGLHACLIPVTQDPHYGERGYLFKGAHLSTQHFENLLLIKHFYTNGLLIILSFFVSGFEYCGLLHFLCSSFVLCLHFIRC